MPKPLADGCVWWWLHKLTLTIMFLIQSSRATSAAISLYLCHYFSSFSSHHNSSRSSYSSHSFATITWLPLLLQLLIHVYTVHSSWSWCYWGAYQYPTMLYFSCLWVHRPIMASLLHSFSHIIRLRPPNYAGAMPPWMLPNASASSCTQVARMARISSGVAEKFTLVQML